MTEQLNPAPSIEPEPWIDGDVQDTLDSEILAWSDPHFGVGQAHQFGPNGSAFLTLYPDSSMVEYYDPNTILSGRHAAKITLTPEHVFFDLSTERQQTFGMAARNGSFSWFSDQLPPVVDAATQDFLNHMRSAERLNGGDAVPPVQVEASVPASEPLSEPLMSETVIETPAAGAPKEKQPRVKVTGRLSRDVLLGQTSRGVPQVRFRLGEHPNPDNPDETTWHEVYSTKQHAERIAKDNLRQGEEVRVTGLLHQSEYADRQTGELKQRQQIYAFSAKRTRPPRAD